MARLKDQYRSEIAPALMKKFGYTSVMQIPKLDKVVINVGCGEADKYGKERWTAKDFRGTLAPCPWRIGCMTRGYDHWYELYPGADTEKVTADLVADLKQAVTDLERRRISG